MKGQAISALDSLTGQSSTAHVSSEEQVTAVRTDRRHQLHPGSPDGTCPTAQVCSSQAT